MTTNSTSLVLADTGQPIPCKGLQLDIDADSWVWGWRADGVPANYLSSLKTTYGDLVELLASVNGTSFRVAVEHITRSRSFGKSALAISGRGRAAWLSAPYAPVANRSNASIMTAQQLMADALTENGVSIGWDIDWQITDWTVPSGVWNHTGTAMEACLAIAEAAGAYIQAHRTDQKLHVLPRFKEAPWNWNSLIPDFEVPEDVCTVESLEWVDLPDYNAVYVSGQTGGVLGHVVKTGSDGAKVAPMVTDPLLTAADAARQRGTSILSATGRQLKIGLSLPVLPETGIITPGKFMRYVESGTPRLGIVRGVSVASNLPKVRQTVQVESYEL